MFAVLLFSLVLGAADPAPDAPEATPPAPPAPAETAPPTKPRKDRLVCRRESIPNSRFTTKTCKTAEEWEERTETAQRAFGEVQNRPTVMVCPPQGC